MTETIAPTEMPELTDVQQRALLASAHRILGEAGQSKAVAGLYESDPESDGAGFAAGDSILADLMDHPDWPTWGEQIEGLVPGAEAPARALPSIQASTGPIHFGGGVPVRGWSNVALYPNGAFHLSGHFHDSGLPSYNVAHSWLITTRDGNPAFSLSASGRCHGTFEPGSRDFNFNHNGVNAAIAAAWPELAGGYRWAWRSAVNLSLPPILDWLRQVLNIAGTIIKLV
ncbi:hypothetical protein ACTWPT_18530 [Nonomuraea sp. 3N208]|uniref:hypothetical protein n=1 Tax=Nonomuraea sp. 3N208 TaxID=3457421 RepID=UPI003FCDCCD5